MARVLILGAGFGGVTAALELKRRLGDGHDLVLADRRPTFSMGLRTNWVVSGRETWAQGTRRIESLRARGIEVRLGSVDAIDLDGRTVRLGGGSVGWDFLVVALGAEPRTDLLPGFTDAAFNLYDAADAERLGARIETFRSGRFAIAIAGLPYKCPPAPFETAMVVDDLLRRRGDRDAVRMTVTTPAPLSLPVLGRARCDQFELLLRDRSIDFRAGAGVERLEGPRVVYRTGDAIEADLLAVVPPHRPPDVVLRSGLAGPDGWIPVDPVTAQAAHPRVWAVGDVTHVAMANGQPLPKAGVFAEGMAVAAAAGIAAELGLGVRVPFDGRGECFAEVGLDAAVVVTGRFLAPGGPQVELKVPSQENANLKRAFERERLASWFGPDRG